MVAAAYPNHPGHKRRRTSRAAAEAIAPKAGSIRSRVYDAIKAKPGTPEEIAARIGVENIKDARAGLIAAGNDVVKLAVWAGRWGHALVDRCEEVHTTGPTGTQLRFWL
jgi:hypothetical protein